MNSGVDFNTNPMYEQLWGMTQPAYQFGLNAAMTGAPLYPTPALPQVPPPIPTQGMYTSQVPQYQLGDYFASNVGSLYDFLSQYAGQTYTLPAREGERRGQRWRLPPKSSAVWKTLEAQVRSGEVPDLSVLGLPAEITESEQFKQAWGDYSGKVSKYKEAISAPYPKYEIPSYDIPQYQLPSQAATDVYGLPKGMEVSPYGIPSGVKAGIYDLPSAFQKPQFGVPQPYDIADYTVKDYEEQIPEEGWFQNLDESVKKGLYEPYTQASEQMMEQLAGKGQLGSARGGVSSAAAAGMGRFWEQAGKDIGSQAWEMIGPEMQRGKTMEWEAALEQARRKADEETTLGKTQYQTELEKAIRDWTAQMTGEEKRYTSEEQRNQAAYLQQLAAEQLRYGSEEKRNIADYMMRSTAEQARYGSEEKQKQAAYLDALNRAQQQYQSELSRNQALWGSELQRAQTGYQNLLNQNIMQWQLPLAERENMYKQLVENQARKWQGNVLQYGTQAQALAAPWSFIPQMFGQASQGISSNTVVTPQSSFMNYLLPMAGLLAAPMTGGTSLFGSAASGLGSLFGGLFGGGTKTGTGSTTTYPSWNASWMNMPW